MLSAAQFLVSLDYSIVSIAVPTIQRDLDFSTSDVQWVITAYAVTFGGLLLAGGRAGDAYGHKRVFVAGLAVLTLASAVGGIAPSAPVLVGARAGQGFGAALAAPAGLALISSLFEQGPERERALGVYGAVLSSGFVTGVSVGGLLTTLLGWRSVMFMSLVMAGVLLVVAVRAVPRTEAGGRAGQLDLTGALSATAGLIALIYAFARAESAGWGSTEVVGLLLGALACAGFFAVAEWHAERPLVPLSAVRKVTLSGGSAVAALAGAGATGAVFVLTLYSQRVLDHSPLETGLVFTALGGAAVVAGVVAPRLLAALGVPRTLVGALFLQTTGTVVLISISRDGNAPLLVAGLVLLGFAHVTAIVGCATLATTGVGQAEHGLFSGILNAAFETGSGIGAATLATVAAGRLDELLPAGASSDLASETLLVDAYRDALAAGVCITLLGGLICLVALVRRSWHEASAIRYT